MTPARKLPDFGKEGKAAASERAFLLFKSKVHVKLNGAGASEISSHHI